MCISPHLPRRHDETRGSQLSMQFGVRQVHLPACQHSHSSTVRLLNV